MHFTPFPILTTDRLVLRQMKSSDDKEILFLRSDARMLEYVDIPKAETTEDARKFIDKINTAISNNESIFWAITLQDDDTLIGTVCIWNLDKEKLTAEIGYMLHPDFQGKGMIQEAIPKAIDYGFNEMKLKSIAGGVHKKNIKSIKVLEKSGFIYNGPIEEEENYISYCLPANT